MNSNSSKEFTFTNVMKLLYQKWKLIALFLVVFLTILIILSFIVPHKYESYSSLMPDSGKSSSSGFASIMEDIGGASLPFAGLGGGQNPKIFNDILLSRSIAEYVTDSCDLVRKMNWNGPVEKLYGLVSDRLEVNVKTNGVIFISTYVETPLFPNDEDADSAAVLAADIINTAVEGLDKINREKSVSNAKRKRILIEKILDRKKGDLDSIDRVIESFQRENKVMSLKEQTKAILDNAITVGSALAEAEIELNLIKLEYDKNSAIVKGYEENLKKLKEQYRRTQRGGIIDDDDFSIPLNEVPELIRIYTTLLREQKVLEKVIAFLETQKYQETIQEESDIPTVQVLDEAYPPIERSAPNRKLVVVLGFLIGLLLISTYIITSAVIKGHIYIRKIDQARKQYTI
jgi:tyrosine-protein kinase Etk/Wzc